VARVRVISDSSCDLPEEFVRQYDIEIVSLSIRFGDEEFTDRVDLTPAEFWAKCKAGRLRWRHRSHLVGRALGHAPGGGDRERSSLGIVPGAGG
jgi:hypothetical protein